MIDFKGKAVIVTGAATGIGAACAEAFVRAGANVALGDVDEEKNIELANRLGQQAVAVQCNVANEDDCANLVSAALETFGGVDVLVNNAGIVAKGNILDLDPNDWDQVMDVNLRAYFILTQKAARVMIDTGRAGAIINMSSVNANLAIPDQLAYVASKGGIQQLTKAAALGLASHGIRVNAVGPGSIMTDLLQQVMEDGAARQKILSRTPMGRVGDTSEVANVVLFLASDMASYITGQTIVPDGGRSILNYTVPVDGPVDG